MCDLGFFHIKKNRVKDENIIEREFGAYRDVQDNYPKYVISMDKLTLSRDGIYTRT